MPSGAVTFDQRDVERLQHTLEKIGRPQLGEIVHDAAPYAQDQARAGAPRASGATSSSLVAKASGLEMKLSSSLPRAAALNYGRAPGATMPPPSAFASRGPEGAFLIARAIGKRGVRGRFFMQRAAKMLHERELPRLVNLAIQKIESLWSRS